jgi:uncharacterized protein (DUF433 family)
LVVRRDFAYKRSMNATAVAPHIWLDDKGRPWIDDTNTKVIEVVLDYLGYGWDVEEMHRNHSYLSKAQLHSAMAYYFDHKEYFDAEVERISKADDEAVEAQRNSPLIQKLRALGKL